MAELYEKYLQAQGASPQAQQAPTVAEPVTGGQVARTETATTSLLDKYNNIYHPPEEKSFLQDITTKGVMYAVREHDRRGVERVKRDLAKRPNLIAELQKEFKKPNQWKEAAKMLIPVFGTISAVKGGGGLALKAMGSVGQVEEALVTSYMDALLDFYSGKGYDGFKRLPAEFKAAFSGMNRKEVGDIFRRAGYPETIAATAGLATMAWADPVGRVIGLARGGATAAKAGAAAGTRAARSGPRQGIDSVREGLAELGRKGAKAGLEREKRITMQSLLNKRGDMVEWVLDPNNNKHISKEVLENPQRVANKELTTVLRTIDDYDSKVDVLWKRVNRDVAPMQLDDLYSQEMIPQIVETYVKDFDTNQVQSVQRALKDNGLLRYDRALKEYVPGNNLTIGDFMRTKTALQEGASRGLPLHTRAVEKITDLLSSVSDDYAEAVTSRKRLADMEIQFNELFGKPGKIAASRSAGVTSKNTDNLLGLWNKSSESFDRNLVDLSDNLATVTNGALRGANHVTRLKAISAGSQFVQSRPMLTGVSIGGLLAVALGKAGVNPTAIGAGMGLLVAESSPKLNLLSAKGLAQALSKTADVTPRTRALRRISGAFQTEAGYRALGGREGDAGETLAAPLDTVLQDMTGRR